MQIYKKILVTTDCSPVDETIIQHVSGLAVQNSAKVYLLHIVHSHTLEQNRIMYQRAETCLESYRKTLQALGIEANIIIRSGEPDREILMEIEKNDFDLVAMATHGHKFIGDMLFGSVSKSLKHRINIPLLLLKPEDGTSRKKQ